jgi:hypothetical protein
MRQSLAELMGCCVSLLEAPALRRRTRSTLVEALAADQGHSATLLQSTILLGVKTFFSIIAFLTPSFSVFPLYLSYGNFKI